MTVIRKGIIELELRAKQQRLEAPKIEEAARAYKEVEKAQKEVAKASAETARAARDTADTHVRSSDASRRSTEELTRSVGLSSHRMSGHFREASEGAMRFARGIAFLSASGEEDMRKLIQVIAVAQGSFDVGIGALRSITALSRIFGPHVAIGVTAVTGALTAGAVAWAKWKANAEEAARVAQESVKRAKQELDAFYESFTRRRDIVGDARSRAIGRAVTPEAREQAIRDELDRQQQIRRTAEADIEQFFRRNIIRPGGREQRVFAEQQLAGALDREIELRQQLADRQLEQLRSELEEAQRARDFLLSGTRDPTTPTGAAKALGADIEDLTGRLQDAEQRANRMLEKLGDLLERQLLRVERLERDISSGNP